MYVRTYVCIRTLSAISAAGRMEEEGEEEKKITPTTNNKLVHMYHLPP